MPVHPIHLLHHPGHSSQDVDRICFAVARAGSGAQLRFDLSGDISSLALPDGSGGARRDELWQHTCFELFLRPDGVDAYYEFNFAPNGDWAAYAFSAYRKDGRDLDGPAPIIRTEKTLETLSVFVHLPELPMREAARLGPSAVIESKAGGLSYWALHQPTDKPDFHAAENFKIKLD